MQSTLHGQISFIVRITIYQIPLFALVPEEDLCADVQDGGATFTMVEAGNDDVTFNLAMRTPVNFMYAGDYKWWGKIFPLQEEANPIYSEAGIVAEKFSKLQLSEKHILSFVVFCYNKVWL